MWLHGPLDWETGSTLPPTRTGLRSSGFEIRYRHDLTEFGCFCPLPLCLPGIDPDLATHQRIQSRTVQGETVWSIYPTPVREPDEPAPVEVKDEEQPPPPPVLMALDA